MQTTLERGWWSTARCNGALRYHWKSLGKIILWALVILLGSQLLSMGIGIAAGYSDAFMGVSVELSTTLLFALICSNIVASKSTRFLLRFGTPRLSVWLCNLLGLYAAMIGLLLGTLLMSMLTGGLTIALSPFYTVQTGYELYNLYGDLSMSQVYSQTLMASLRSLPQYILYTVEWTSIFYLLSCCLRRNKWATLGVIIGVPLIAMLLMLIPAIRGAINVVENGTQGEIMVMGAQWMQYLYRAMDFVQEQWPTIQLSSAVVSLPLSYWCMRSTPQP